MSACDFRRPRQCCQCERQNRWPSSLIVGSMMHPSTGIIHWMRAAKAYELDVNYVSVCGLWWVYPWDERRTELVPLADLPGVSG